MPLVSPGDGQRHRLAGTADEDVRQLAHRQSARLQTRQIDPHIVALEPCRLTERFVGKPRTVSCHLLIQVKDGHGGVRQQMARPETVLIEGLVDVLQPQIRVLLQLSLDNPPHHHGVDLPP